MFKKIFFALLLITNYPHVSEASDRGFTFSLINEHGAEVHRENFVPARFNPAPMNNKQCLDTDHWTDYVACPLMTTCCIYSYTVCPYATYAMTGCCLAAVICEQSYKEPKRIE